MTTYPSFIFHSGTIPHPAYPRSSRNLITLSYQAAHHYLSIYTTPKTSKWSKASKITTSKITLINSNFFKINTILPHPLMSIRTYPSPDEVLQTSQFLTSSHQVFLFTNQNGFSYPYQHIQLGPCAI